MLEWKKVPLNDSRGYFYYPHVFREGGNCLIIQLLRFYCNADFSSLCLYTVAYFLKDRALIEKKKKQSRKKKIQSRNIFYVRSCFHTHGVKKFNWNTSKLAHYFIYPCTFWMFYIFPGIHMGSKGNSTGLHFVYTDKRRIALF